MKTHIRTVVVLLAALLSTTFTPTATRPASAQAALPPPPAGQECVAVVAPLRPGERVSEVESYQCASKDHPLAEPAGRTLIMTWYNDDQYRGGGGSTRVYGRYGPCDSEGYGINYVGKDWNDKITSFKVWNRCTYTRAYTDANYGGKCQAYVGNVPNVGRTLNDHISSFWVAASRKACERGVE